MTATLPVHLHAENFENIEGMPDDMIAPLVGRLSSLRDGFTRVANAKRDIMADTSMTEDGRLLSLDELYQANVTPLIGSVQASANAVKISRQIAAARRDEVFTPSKDVGDITLASEIRSRLFSLPPAERLIALRDATEAGEKRIMSAVLSGPGFLSGIVSADQHGFRERYIELHHPDLDALRRGTDEATGRSERALSELANIRQILFTGEEERRLERIRARRAHAKRHLD